MEGCEAKGSFGIVERRVGINVRKVGIVERRVGIVEWRVRIVNRSVGKLKGGLACPSMVGYQNLYQLAFHFRLTAALSYAISPARPPSPSRPCPPLKKTQMRSTFYS